MKLRKQQTTKRVTTYEVVVTPKEAVRIIEGLASGIRAVSMDEWNNYWAGSFAMDKYQIVGFRVEQED